MMATEIIVNGVLLIVAIGLRTEPTLLTLYAIGLILLRWMERSGVGTTPQSKASREPKHERESTRS